MLAYGTYLLCIMYYAANTHLVTFVVEETHVQWSNHLSQTNQKKLFGILYVDFLSCKYSTTYT